MSKTPSQIHAETKQTRSLAVAALFQTTDRVRREIAERLAPFEVTPQQYNVLRILRGAGPDGLATLEIAERMVEDAPGITRLLDRLETKNLVSRERAPTDRRQLICRISRRGLQLLADVDRKARESEDVLGGVLTEQDLKRLVELLDKIRAGLRRK